MPVDVHMDEEQAHRHFRHGAAQEIPWDCEKVILRSRRDFIHGKGHLVLSKAVHNGDAVKAGSDDTQDQASLVSSSCAPPVFR